MKNTGTYFFSPEHYASWKEKDIAHVNEQLRAEIERLRAENVQLKKRLAEMCEANTAPVVRERHILGEAGIVPQYEPNSVVLEYHILKEGVNLSGDVDKSTIIKIVFEASLKGKPNNAWDVSEAQDKSIMAWVDEQNILHVGSDGIICANPDSGSLFQDYSNVIEIDFGENFDTSKASDMSDMFSGCENLTELNLTSFDTSRVTDMCWMFAGCKNLTGLNLGSFNTSKVTDMHSMFFGCENLTKLNLDSFHTSKVTDMSSMFYYCKGLNKLNVSSFDTSKVVDMSHMFSHCESLRKLDCSNFDTSRVTDMSYMFFYCSSLTELNISGFDTGNVNDMNSVFEGCTAPFSMPKAKR